MIKLKKILTEDVNDNNTPQTPIDLFYSARKKKIFTRWSINMDDDASFGNPYANVTVWRGGLPAAEDFWEISFSVDAGPSTQTAEISVRTTKLNKNPISALKSDFIRLNKTGDTTLHEYDVLPHLVADPEEHESFKYHYKLTTRVSSNKSNAKDVTNALVEMIQQSFKRIVG